MRRRLSRIKRKHGFEASFIGAGTMFCLVALAIAFL